MAALQLLVPASTITAAAVVYKLEKQKNSSVSAAAVVEKLEKPKKL